VLFDRALFAELMSLEGDTGGRTLFDRHTVQFVDWDDTKILLDVDTPEDLARLMEEESLGQANHWDQVSRAQTGNDAVQQARVAAVVLAAGQSRRMGQPKMALPWGRGTVIEAVVQLLQEAGVMDIVVVTGGARETVEQALAGNPVRLVHNPQYARSEMVGSLQEGIRALPVDCAAALVVLGDQPGISPEVVRAVIERYRAEGSPLVAPSYQMRRGHPWLAARVTWPELLALAPQDTLRDFLRRHAADMAYVVVDSPAILKDLDTPQDYAEQKPAETS
jgi:molybdenum cofactor cytidylyltransferase